MEQSLVCQTHLAALGEANLERLHDAAVAILEATGLNVHHVEMRRRLAAAGARLGEEPRVYLPGEMVERALGSARRDVTIYDRLGEAVMPLVQHRCYYGTGSDLVYTRNEAGQRRMSVLDDAGRAARLCDALPELDFVMSFALPSDVPNDNAEPQQYYTLLHNTTKPLILTSFSGPGGLERVHSMACTIAGGEEAFRKRPNYVMYGQFVSPLQHDPLAVGRLIFCAEHEVPLIYIPTIIPGASGPLTLAGSLALAVAECLAGLVMQQTQRPGAPFVFGACVSQLDMRTMLFPYGAPEWRLNDVVMAEMARHYGLPVFGTGGATDSKLVDAQAGTEYAFSLLVAALAGTNLIHDVGYLDSGLTGSLESIVLGAEQIRWVKRFVAGLELTDEMLALPAISEVGPGGQFLDHTHTLKHLRRNQWMPYVLDHRGYDSWVADGARDYAARARDYASQVVESHRPQAIVDAVEGQLRELARIDA